MLSSLVVSWVLRHHRRYCIGLAGGRVSSSLSTKSGRDCHSYETIPAKVQGGSRLVCVLYERTGAKRRLAVEPCQPLEAPRQTHGRPRIPKVAIAIGTSGWGWSCCLGILGRPEIRPNLVSAYFTLGRFLNLDRHLRTRPKLTVFPAAYRLIGNANQLTEAADC